MKLFSLRCTQTNKHHTEHYGDKKRAKAERDRLNSQGGSWVVTPGPDHHKRTGSRS